MHIREGTIASVLLWPLDAVPLGEDGQERRRYGHYQCNTVLSCTRREMRVEFQAKKNAQQCRSKVAPPYEGSSVV